MKTTEQARAAYALACVQGVIANHRVASADYRRYAIQYGAMVHTNGLGQALAFARSKASGNTSKAKAWKLLYDHVSNWLTGHCPTDTSLRHPRPPLGTGQQDAIVAITQQDVTAYMLATAETMALAVWLKRLAEALIEGNQAAPVAPPVATPSATPEA